MMEPTPTLFSVVIPTYRRPEKLRACLKSLVLLEYPRDRFEVIVIDDGSEISPSSLAASFSADIDVRLLTQYHAGPAAARNKGAAYARGSILVFIDDDCEPAADWLHRLDLRFAAAPKSLIGGRTINALPSNPYSTASQLLMGYLLTRSGTQTEAPYFFASNNLAVPKSSFLYVGGFNPRFPLAAGEDRDFCDRWISCGFQMTYAPELRVYHRHRMTIGSFIKKHFTYGRGAYIFHKEKAGRSRKRMKLENLTFYLNIVRFPFSLKVGWRAALYAVLMLLSQTAITCGFVYEWRLKRHSG